MRHKNSRKTVAKKRRAGGRWHLPSFRYGQKYVWLFISIICVVSLFICSYYFYKDWKADEVLKEQQEELKTQIENTDVSSHQPFKMPTAGMVWNTRRSRTILRMLFQVYGGRCLHC